MNTAGCEVNPVEGGLVSGGAEHVRRLRHMICLLGPYAGTATGDPGGQMFDGCYHTDEPSAPNSSASWTSVYLNAPAGNIYAVWLGLRRGGLLLG
jgi:hypothetical protein